MGSDGLLRIGELAKKTGTTLRTIRYYQQLGLISHFARTRGGFHLFFPESCQRIQFVKNMQLLGAPLAKIRRLLERCQRSASGAELAPELIEILSGQLKEIEARVATSLQMQESIQRTLEILKVCRECRLEPSKEVCYQCDAITSIKEVPLPMQALIAAS